MPTRNHHKEKPAMEEAKTDQDASFVTKTVENTKRLGAYLQDTAEQAAKGVGAGLESLGGAIHENEPDSGVLRDAGEALAGRLASGGQYLETHGISGVAEDVANLIRRNPVPALLIGVGVGLLVARLMKRS